MWLAAFPFTAQLNNALAYDLHSAQVSILVILGNIANACKQHLGKQLIYIHTFWKSHIQVKSFRHDFLTLFTGHTHILNRLNIFKNKNKTNKQKTQCIISKLENNFTNLEVKSLLLCGFIRKSPEM